MKTTRILLLSLAFQSLAILPVPAQPAITVQPRKQTVILYQSAAFGVIAAGARGSREHASRPVPRSY